MKKLLSTLLAVSLILGPLPSPSFAKDEDKCKNPCPTPYAEITSPEDGIATNSG